MGIHVYLHVDDRRIEPGQWEALYHEASEVTRGYPDGAITLARFEVRGIETIAVSTDVFVQGQDGPCIRICGDARSRVTGETFEFPRRLRQRMFDDPEDRIVDRDPLLAPLADGEGPGGMVVFGAKTQGYPFHDLIVALATLAENRLAGLALVHGDLCPADGERACDLLHRTLGGDFLPPIVVDEPRLRVALARFVAEPKLSEVVQIAFRGPEHPIVGDILGLLKSAGGSRVDDDLELRLRGLRSLDELHEDTLEFMAQFGDTIAEAFVRLEAAERSDSVLCCSDVDALLRTIAASGVVISTSAWRRLETLPIEPLRFCAALSLFRAASRQWHASHLVRGVLENELVRRHVYEAWAAASSHRR